MLTNAVSSAFGRLYATPAIEEDRMAVRRIEAVDRLKPVDPGAQDRATGGRDQREFAAQRDAMMSGVREAFQALGSTPTATSDEDLPVPGEPPNPQPIDEPDPLLDAAILRFMHAVFRSLAEADGPTTDAVAPAARREADGTAYAEPAQGRQQLAGRIEALAAGLAAAGRADDRLSVPDAAATSIGAPTGPASDPLPSAFRDALHALRGDHRRSTGADASAARPLPTRGDLVQLLQRLAQSIDGAASAATSLPTTGSLLRERA